MDLLLGPSTFAFYEGQLSILADVSGLSGPVRRTVPNTITLDGWTYAIDLAEYQFGPQDTFRDGVVANDEPNDSLFNARGAWSRYRISWHRGSDQEISDLDADADPFRFESSHGFDPWERYQLGMLPYAWQDDDVTIDTSTALILRSGPYLFVANGTQLWRYDTGFGGFQAMTAPGGSINALASDGNDLYVATSTGMRRYIGTATTASAFSTPITTATDNVGFVANRLLVGQGNVLAEVAAAGTLTTVITHYQPGFRWTTMFAIGSRIYVGGYAGVKSELYSLTTTEGGLLVRGTEAAPFPIGEQLLTGLSVGGAVLLGTTVGVRFAQIGADGTLTYGPLIDTPGACRQIAAEGRFAWITWNDTTTHSAGFRGTARLDLTQFVNVLQPAYAADVQMNVAADGQVIGVERYLDGTWFIVGGRGLYFAADNGLVNGAPSFARTAKMRSGRFYFGTVESKGLVELVVRFEALTAGAAVTARVIDADGVFAGQGTQDAPGATTLVVPLNGVRTREASVELEVTQTGAVPVTILDWAMRAYPVPPAVLQWIVPINTHEIAEINDSEGEDMSQGVREVVDRIEELHSSRRLVNYLEGGRLYRVRVESFKHEARKWTDDGSAPVGLLHVQLVSA